ncbi:hypothetical protein BKA24_001352 [Microbacterium marinum]|uniref:Uncharacterized protein n=1 Tax=Microbacterium marinum TaxID=421115 RepID=A0A7W7BPV8_9MICO|nr:hypothetical protein [Microbacterium marinum]MBB4666643.1 hypothetical protein [Microbacterium marinum]
MSTDRQRIVRVPGARRARLTPAPGTDPSPETTNGPETGNTPASGPNDDRLRNDVPPHY